MSHHRRRISIDRVPWRPTRLALIVALACVTALLAGCYSVRRAPDGTVTLTPVSVAESAEKAKPKAEQATSKEPAHPEDDVAPVGTSFKTGSWEVTVTSVKPHKKMSNGQKPRKGRLLIYVNVKVKNIGSTVDLKVKPTQFWLEDSAGKKVKPFKTDLLAFNAQQVRPVQMAMGGKTTFVYEIPKDATGYVFNFKKRKTSPRVYHWQAW